MAITIPSGCYQQPTEAKGVDAQGNSHYNFILKGLYATLETLADGISQGDEVVADWYALSLE